MVDDRALRDLVARYVECVALFDVDLFRTLWTDDAAWVVDGRGTYRGPEDITALFAELRGRQELAVQRITSGRANHDGVHGVGRWVIHSVTRTAGKGAELIGVYDDRYRCTDGRWSFVERAFTPLYRGARDLPGRTWAPPPANGLAFGTGLGEHG